jgi:Bacterial membrane protein YfhO
VKRNHSARRRAPATNISWKNRLRPFFTLLPGSCLLLVGALIFWQFLFGDAVLLYKDIGSDSLISYYPDFVHLSDYIRSQGIPSWSFCVGMGQDLAYAANYLIWQPVSWLPKELIAPALIFQHLGKILIAGLIFFRFLQLRHLHSPAPLLGSLLLSFSAYMCMGSCWYPLADEVVCFAGILLAIEEAVQHGRWLILALAVALVGMITPFHLYLCALFLLTYVPIRLFGQYAWHPRIILRTCLVLAAVAALGVGLGAIVTLPYLDAVLNSPRGSGATSAVAALRSFPFLGLESPLHYITAALKPFANDMLGVGDDFRGWQNYLEAPLTYCGLLCLLIFPQILTGGPRRHRIILVLFLIGMLVPTVFPWFRYLFWLFQGDYYRAYSLFCVLGMIILSMMVFSRYIQGRALSFWILAATTGILIGTLYLPFEQLQTLIDPALRRATTIFLLLYGMMLAAGQLLKRQELAAWLILGLAAIELIQFDRITVSNRKTVSKQELRAKVGYNDETVDALRDIKASDNSFFRVTKLRPSALSVLPSFNDAMVFGYYGTSSYSSFNSVNYTNFLTAVGAIRPNSESHTRWSMGLADSALLSAFACEKYVLVDDLARFQTTFHYESIKRYGNDFLFRNQLFLPLGLTYSHYMAEDVFLRLPSGEKQEALLRAVVLSNENETEKQELSQLTVSELEQDIGATPLPEVVAARRKTALDLTSFGQTRFEGKVFLDQKSILVLQTPFDRGWRALQDGQAAPMLKVDVGLLGVGLDAGEHKVELHYRNPFLVPALVVTLASFLILAASLWRWPRLALPA